MTGTVCLLLLMLCSSAGAGISMSGGPWEWRESEGGLEVAAGNTAFISRELVQLIDLSTG